MTARGHWVAAVEEDGDVVAFLEHRREVGEPIECMIACPDRRTATIIEGALNAADAEPVEVGQ